jgi:leader peptidase (prepilin peptidase)/N-methyltransferase
MSNLSWIVLVLAALGGWLAGVVVNTLADYLPGVRFVAVAETDSPAAPLWPHYPDRTRRPWSAWSGLAAFLGGGRMSAGGARLAWRHPIVEALLAVAYGLVFLYHGWNAQTAFYMVFLAIMALIVIIDLEHRLVLFAVILPACALAVLEAASLPEPPPTLRDALLGGALGLGLYGVMFLGGILFSRLSRTNEIAFGFGDVMLGTLSGLLLGWQPLFFALVLTIFFGAVGAMAFLASKVFSRTGYSLFTALPYGPYIVAATLVVMFWRDEIRVWLIGG